MTLNELKQFDGRDGRKAYVAVAGKVYDFSGSPLWEAGDHQGAHQAGCDLTEELRSAPHVRAVIERFPIIAELETETPVRQKGRALWLIAAVVLLGLGLLLLR